MLDAMSRTAIGALGALLFTVVSAASAQAHIRLDEPLNRYDNPQKTGPCGAGDDERTERVTVYAPGQTITVAWEETIDHPSHYRIAFSQRGTEDFEDPRDFDDFYTNDAVLLDEISDRDGGGAYEIEVTLPDVECEDCTLQLMQIMYDKSFEQAFYYQCADLELREGGGSDAGPGPDESGGGGCRASGRSGAGGAAALVLALAVFYAPRLRRVRAG
jgi:hypothetical protein